MSRILITGATGHVGSDLIRQLTTQGHQLRALVHSREKAAGLPKQVEWVVGDLAHPATLGAPVTGVDCVFLMDPGNGLDFTKNIVDAGKQAGVRLIVDLSSLTAGVEPMPIMGRMFSNREAVIKASGIEWTLLRPGQFMTNVLSWLPSIKAHGVVRDPLGPGRVASIDPADIATVAARALTQEGHTGQIYSLTGGELLTMKQQVDILASVLNRSIEYVDITPEEAAQDALAKGRDQASVAAIKEMNEMGRAGMGAFITDDVERVTGQKPASFEHWCRRNAAAFG